MAELQSSATLLALFEKARGMGKNPEAMPISAFFLALLEGIKTNPDNAEFSACKILLDGLGVNLAAGEELLTRALADGLGNTAGSEYFQKVMESVRNKAQRKNRSFITVDMMLEGFLTNPDPLLEQLLKCKGGSTPQGRSEEVEQPSQGGISGAVADLLSKKFRAGHGIADPVADTAAPSSEATPLAGNGDSSTPSGEATPDSTKGEIETMVAKVKEVRRQLCSAVFGQDNAINVFTTGYFQAGMLSLLDNARTRPLATFLFAGPPGVGKTFLAEQAAGALKLPFMRFDMSEYADKEANIEFCGSDKVYKNAKAGNVTEFVAKNPHCVLLFDEIEKAHSCVIHLFLQMLDAGRLRDNFTDEEVSFKDTILIFTTNAGRGLYEESENGDFSALSRKVIVRALQKDVNPETGVPYFPGALCSRFASGNVVMFNHIAAHNLRAIAAKEMGRQAGNVTAGTNIAFDIDPRVYTSLLFSEGSKADARTIRSRAQAFINDELYELLRFVASEKVGGTVANLESVSIGLDLSKATDELKELFAPGQKPETLVFAPAPTFEFCKENLPQLALYPAGRAQEGIALLKEKEIATVLLDMSWGKADGAPLNLEDVDSPARDFLKFVKQQGIHVPIYLLEHADAPYSEEEVVSFLSQGIRGVLSMENGEDFGAQVMEIAGQLHQQASMNKLAKQNKLVSFETMQTLSADGKQAAITLFDFEMAVAIDSEDAKNVLSGLSKPNVHFEDIIGAGDAKQELAYFVEYLKNPKKYMGTGVKAPKGILLYGPPGTGKTMLAKAMACEANVTFLAAEGNAFLKKYVGEGSEKVHELFRTARKYAPAILFIDEIDAIGKERRGAEEGSTGVDATLTAFLTEMDGFVNDPTKPVFVLAATNFEVEPGTPKSLDAALLRRFDRRVLIDLPKKEDRILFLNKKIAANGALQISKEQVENLAIRSTGMSLSALDSVVELALRSAIRKNSTVVTDAILEEAFEVFNSGEEKKWEISQLERVARHEAGHALLCYLSGETPSYLTIVARGNHGGYMQHGDHEGKAIYTKEELLARIRTSLGGRAAEMVYYGKEDGVSTGASGDLENATATARNLLCRYGMDAEFGLAVVREGDTAMSPAVRDGVNAILEKQMELAFLMLTTHKEKLDRLVDALMAKNHLKGEEIEALLG